MRQFLKFRQERARKMFASIVLLSQPYTLLTYALPESFPDSFWQPGLRVAVPLGKLGLRAGYVFALSEDSGLPSGVKCRPVCWPLETEPLIPQDIAALANDLCIRHGIEPGRVLGNLLPRNLRSTRVKVKAWRNNQSCEWTLEQISQFESGQYDCLANNLLTGRAVIIQPQEDVAAKELCVLKVDPPWPVRPAARRQLEILDYLHGRTSPTRRDLLKALGSDRQKSLESLVKAGMVEIALVDSQEELSDRLLPPPDEKFELTQEQKCALDDFTAALFSDRPECRLLYGITGSGKTAVYLELARRCLESGQSVFLLAPEVALATKLFRDARERFPDFPVYLYHGYQTPGKREEIFRALGHAAEAALVVGTRSALFLPAFSPGCIILDEEHDSSYKQDEGFAYHAKEVAWFRIKAANGLLALGSATPDIRTFFAGEQGNVPLRRLSKRPGGQALPPARLVNMGVTAGSMAENAQGAGLLAPESEAALRQCLEKGEQAVILLNRRGYSAMLYCVNCSKILRCPQCEIGLCYHKSIGKLVCHYCGYTVAWPAVCPDCGKMSFLDIGEGTEKLADRLESMAGQPILRLDRDSVGRQGAMEEILDAFASQKSPFLVGTQMLSKGHHFPNVTLVLAADGDVGLNLPDYRAAERSFQLLVQAAGRAGRGEKPGQVLIQTRNPQHYCWNYITNYDYEGFYAAELARRKKRLYPPFICLGLLRISWPVEDEKGLGALNELARELKGHAGKSDMRILGPAPAPLAMLRGRRRYQCLIKAPRWPQIRELYYKALSLKCASRLKLFLDLDPVNML